MKKVLFFLVGTMLLTSCAKDHLGEIQDNKKVTEEQINDNVKKVFGTTFASDHDWCTTKSGEVTVKGIPSTVSKVQLMVYVTHDDGENSVLKLNEAETNGSSTAKLTYDMPENNLGLYVAFLSSNGFSVVPVNGDVASYGTSGITRGTESYPIPTGVTPTIGTIEDSYASIRGWVPGEKLYSMSDYGSQIMDTGDYDDAFKGVFRAIIFSYFKNGRNYDNLPLVMNSSIYNESAYPFTTGKKPIVVTPVYKRDGAGKYGNEVYNSDLYYFYYQDGTSVTKEFLQSLPKYKAIPLNTCFTDNEDDIIGKRGSYTLIYWGDAIPESGAQGSYQFPEGYKIGFMVRAKTTAEGGKKQGELYADGRLNNEINNYDKCNFKSSKFGQDEPRAAWLTVNDKMLLTFESGTDRDFNDVIFEVEGGVKPIINIPEIPDNVYTFCFEDTELGDYDMNDVVIKAVRKSETQVEYSIVACGAYDELYVKGINGSVIKDTEEVHGLFGVQGGFINTERGDDQPFVTDYVTVPKTFSFLDEATQPYIYDKTTGLTVKLSKKGQDPHGIMIPYDFKYPVEKICIKNAYADFNKWGMSPITSTNWFMFPIERFVY